MTNKWDSQFQDLTKELEELEAPFQAMGVSKNIEILQKNSAILQYQNAIESTLESLAFYKNRSENLPPKLRSITSWSLKIASQISLTLNKRASLLGRSLWISLIRQRAGVHHQENMVISDMDIMEYATKQLALKNRESELNKELISLSKAKKTLHQQYERFKAQESVKQASLSTQPESLRKEENLLAYQCLSQFINNLSTTTRATTPLEKSFQDKQKDLVKGTNEVMSQCESMIKDDISATKFMVTPSQISEINNKIKELEILKKEIITLKQDIFSKQPTPLRPIMVKNTKNQATT